MPRIIINHDKLTDAPFHDGNKDIFRTTEHETRDFSNDLIKGNATCYMISGYRGSGKSSYINRLRNKVKETCAEIVFVHVNFSKHEPRTLLMRKLIRNFYKQLTEHPDNKEVYKKALKDPKTKTTFLNFKELYEHTFFDVADSHQAKYAQKLISKIQINSNELLLVVGGLLSTMYFLNKLESSEITSYAPIVISLLAVVFPFLKQFGTERTKEAEHEAIKQKIKTSLYDDEIAEYNLNTIIKGLKPHVRPVFVVDELDKIQDKALVEQTMNDLKPLMLSGDASFIIVAGQQLFYQYYYSQVKDDHALSSIFSRVHHVQLLPSSELKNLFRTLSKTNIDGLGPTDQQLVEGYLSKTIFQAKRVPRSFVSIIRQQIVWEDSDAVLYIDDAADLSRYTTILSSVDTYSSDVIAGKDYPPAIADFINMQLLINIDKDIHERPEVI